MKKHREELMIFFFCIVSALLLIFAFPPFHFGFLAYLALAPLFFALFKEIGPRKALNIGFLWGLIFYLASFHWFHNIFGIQGLILIAIISIFPAIFACLVAYIREKHGVFHAAVWAPVFWTGIEYFRSELWPLKFTWMALGYSQHEYLRMIQFADILGVYGITFYLISINSFLAFSLHFFLKKEEDASLSKKRQVILTTFIFAATVAIIIYSGMCLKRSYSGKSAINIMGVQSEQDSDWLLDETKREIDEDKRNVELIIWPEYSMPLLLDQSQRMLEKIKEIAKEKKVYFLFGGKERNLANGSPLDFRNTVFLVSPDGRIVGRAVKMNPIQFFNDGEPGRDFSVLRTDHANPGVGICYDMDYTYVSRNLSRRGADILIFPTLDVSSWGRVQHIQHAAMTRFRAIENRRYMVRVAASGVSQIVDSHGRIRDSYGMKYEGAFRAKCFLGKHKTMYVRFGYLFSYLCTALTILFPVILFACSFAKRHGK
jgi:apolipoprotein N-acyltransferase